MHGQSRVSGSPDSARKNLLPFTAPAVAAKRRVWGLVAFVIIDPLHVLASPNHPYSFIGPCPPPLHAPPSITNLSPPARHRPSLKGQQQPLNTITSDPHPPPPWTPIWRM